MLKNIILVAVGGAAGSVLRYLLSGVVQEASGSAFPFGTMAVNVAGCLVIGFIAALAEAHGAVSADVRLILTTGFCGGFTTFSTFMNESLTLMRADNAAAMLLYVAASVVLGLAAAAAGMMLGRMV